jgi:hypothetical protein
MSKATISSTGTKKFRNRLGLGRRRWERILAPSNPRHGEQDDEHTAKSQRETTTATIGAGRHFQETSECTRADATSFGMVIRRPGGRLSCWCQRLLPAERQF